MQQMELLGLSPDNQIKVALYWLIGVCYKTTKFWTDGGWLLPVVWLFRFSLYQSNRVPELSTISLFSLKLLMTFVWEGNESMYSYIYLACMCYAIDSHNLLTSSIQNSNRLLCILSKS